MSKPGFWRTGTNKEIALPDMEEGYLKNVLRYVRKKVVEDCDALARPLASAYWENKLVELGNEAQSRGLFTMNGYPPGADMTINQLKEVILIWQNDWNTRNRRRYTGHRTAPGLQRVVINHSLYFDIPNPASGWIGLADMAALGWRPANLIVTATLAAEEPKLAEKLVPLVEKKRGFRDYESQTGF